MATPSAGPSQLQPLGVLLPGISMQRFFRLNGRALWRSSGGRTQTIMGRNDAGLPRSVVYEATAALTELPQFVDQQRRQFAELDAENAALWARLGASQSCVCLPGRDLPRLPGALPAGDRRDDALIS
jgi:hypothetical protein